MKIFLIGASGCFGTELRQVCNNKKIQLFCLPSSKLDILDYKKLYSQITLEKPNVIVNSAALVGINQCENNYKDAFAINSLGPLNLAKISNKLNITLVQASTHAVFDGKKETPYNEDDVPKPNNVYSGSKYLGELFVSSICNKYYIIRFPTLFGNRSNNLKGFVDKVIQKLSVNEDLKIATDKIDSPTYAKDAAELLLEIILKRKDYGVYHLCNEGCLSYYEFVNKIKDIIGSKSKIFKAKDSDFPSDGFKPLKTAITSNKIKKIRTWIKALSEYLKSINV